MVTTTHLDRLDIRSGEEHLRMTARLSTSALSGLATTLGRKAHRTAGNVRSAHALAWSENYVAEATQPEAGPSRQPHPRNAKPSTHATSATDSIAQRLPAEPSPPSSPLTEVDALGLRKLGWLLTLKSGLTTKSLHQTVWRQFNHLSPLAKQSLDPVFLGRVLRKVVPPIDSISIGSDHPHWNNREKYQSRLSTVLSYLQAARDKESDPTRRATSDREDYHFVLRHLAAYGYLLGTEQVIADMNRRGVPHTRETHELRLASLAKWLRHHSDKHNRMKLGKTFVPGGRYTTLSQKEPFFPPDASQLLAGVIQDLRGHQMLRYRTLTLDLLLRVVKEAGSERAMETILRSGYGVDLHNLDANTTQSWSAKGKQAVTEDQWAEDLIRDVGTSSAARNDHSTHFFDAAVKGHTPYVPVTAHSLNTVLDAIARKGDVWKMTQVFEVLSQPLDERVEATSDGVARLLAGIPHKVAPDVKNKVGETPSPEEEAPVTLSEAIRKEEQSGQAINVFGRPRSPPPPSVAVDETHPALPFSAFLSPVPSPKEVEDAVKAQPDLSDLLAAGTNPAWTRANGNTFSLLLRGCNNAAHASGSSHQQEGCLMLALHYLRHAVREDMMRRNEFLARYVAIRQETGRRLAGLQQDATVSPDKASELEAIYAWQSDALGRLAHPGTLVSAKQIEAAIRMAKHARGSAKQRFLDRVLQEAEAAYDSQIAEYKVLVAPQSQSAAGTPSADGGQEATGGRRTSRFELSTHVRLLHVNVQALAALIYHHAAKAERRRMRLRGMKGPLWRASAADHSGVQKRRMAKLEAAAKNA